ncbi:hypothetical protein ACA910_000057 [Epithemia clementina (nom. ined.)]
MWLLALGSKRQLVPRPSLAFVFNSHRSNGGGRFPVANRCGQEQRQQQQKHASFLSTVTNNDNQRRDFTRTTTASLSSSLSSSKQQSSAEITTTTTTVSTELNDNQNNKAQVKYKIAVVGAGAVGSYYGARLWEAGHDVQFYTRSKPTMSSNSDCGLHVSSLDGDIVIPQDQWQVFDNVTKMQAADWIVVALKSTALSVIPDLIWPLMRSNGQSRVLVIMNGLIENDLIQMLHEKSLQQQSQETMTMNSNIKNQNDTTIPKQNQLSCCRALYGGMALICSNRLSPTRIDHSYAGLLAAGVAASSCNNVDNVHEDEEAFRLLFQGSKVPITYEPNLLRGRWKKMIWNLPFNGISVAMGGITVDEIVQDVGLRELAVAIMDETIAAGNAELQASSSTLSLSSSSSTLSWEPLGEAEKDQMMALSDNMGPYKTSTMLDFTHRRSMEVEYLFREPIRRADRLGIPVPHLRTIVTMIEAYQRKYKL